MRGSPRTTPVEALATPAGAFLSRSSCPVDARVRETRCGSRSHSNDSSGAKSSPSWHRPGDSRRWRRPARAPHLAKYVVALFCPTARSFFLASPSFRIRGSSFDCRFSSARICSARRPFLRLLNRETTISSTFAMSSAERRASRPDDGARAARGGAGACGVVARRVSCTAPRLPISSSREELRTASRTESTNDVASAEIRDWSRLAMIDSELTGNKRNGIASILVSRKVSMTSHRIWMDGMQSGGRAGLRPPVRTLVHAGRRGSTQA